MCPRINKEYRKYLMNDIKDVSDFPFSDDVAEDLCEKFEKVSIIEHIHINIVN